MERGWNAKGRLTPLYKRFGGRDGTEKLTGVSGTTLSNYNSGSKPMGITNGTRISERTGVSLADLGAPPEVQEEDRVRRIVREEVQEQLAETHALLDRILSRVQQLRGDGPEAAGTDLAP